MFKVKNMVHLIFRLRIHICSKARSCRGGMVFQSMNLHFESTRGLHLPAEDPAPSKQESQLSERTNLHRCTGPQNSKRRPLDAEDQPVQPQAAILESESKLFLWDP